MRLEKVVEKFPLLRQRDQRGATAGLQAEDVGGPVAADPSTTTPSSAGACLCAAPFLSPLTTCLINRLFN